MIFFQTVKTKIAYYKKQKNILKTTKNQKKNNGREQIKKRKKNPNFFLSRNKSFKKTAAQIF